jgi:Zn-dependent peptidase ImmA (M78 family)
MANEDICPPFMEDDEIKAKAEHFRSRFARCKKFPIDIEGLVEVDLKIYIQPEKGLKSYGNTDAFISSDFRTMHVDEYEYMDERYVNRLRFSMAHEISHIFLHAELYPKQLFNDLDDYIKFHRSKSDKAHKWFEYQANNFAGNLLVPALELRRFFDEQCLAYLKKHDPVITVRSAEYLKRVIADAAMEYFGVSENVISRRISDEHISARQLMTGG